MAVVLTCTITGAESPIPEDVLLAEILPRLPVESLVRFRCVCKSWKSKISNPDFIKSHLNCTTHNPNHQNMVFIKDVIYMISTKIKHSRGISIFSLSNLSETAVWHHVPCSYKLINLIGSVNGLVCLFINDLSQFVVCNPAIRQARKFCNAPVTRIRLLGFCWNHVENDYKVVVNGFSSMEESFATYVYSCKSDSWTLLPKLSFPADYSNKLQPAVMLDGVPYWTRSRYCNVTHICVFSVIKFEVRSNQFRVLPEFDSALSDQDGFLLVNLKECIGALLYKMWSCDCMVDLYCLDDKSGVWSKMYNVGPVMGHVDRLFHYFKYGGEILLKYGQGKPMCYDPKANKIKDLANTVGYVENCFSYHATLVFLEGMKPWSKPIGSG